MKTYKVLVPSTGTFFYLKLCSAQQLVNAWTGDHLKRAKTDLWLRGCFIYRALANEPEGYMGDVLLGPGAGVGLLGHELYHLVRNLKVKDEEAEALLLEEALTQALQKLRRRKISSAEFRFS